MVPDTKAYKINHKMVPGTKVIKLFSNKGKHDCKADIRVITAAGRLSFAKLECGRGMVASTWCSKPKRQVDKQMQ